MDDSLLELRFGRAAHVCRLQGEQFEAVKKTMTNNDGSRRVVTRDSGDLKTIGKLQPDGIKQWAESQAIRNESKGKGKGDEPASHFDPRDASNNPYIHRGLSQDTEMTHGLTGG